MRTQELLSPGWPQEYLEDQSASLANVYRWILSDLTCYQVYVWSASFELVDHLEDRHVASSDAQEDSILLPKRFKT